MLRDEAEGLVSLECSAIVHPKYKVSGGIVKDALFSNDIKSIIGVPSVLRVNIFVASLTVVRL